jgi:hypothetical protein
MRKGRRDAGILALKGIIRSKLHFQSTGRCGPNCTGFTRPRELRVNGRRARRATLETNGRNLASCVTDRLRLIVGYRIRCQVASVTDFGTFPDELRCQTDRRELET